VFLNLMTEMMPLGFDDDYDDDYDDLDDTSIPF
jgi:hypothetical protein